jgi:hypothetical protein
MAANCRIHPCKQKAPIARFRSRLAAAAIAAALADADVGSVYFDNEENVAAGRTLFSAALAGVDNVGMGVEGFPELRQIRIGTAGKQRRTFLAGIGGTTLSGPAQPMLIKANGQLGRRPVPRSSPRRAGSTAASPRCVRRWGDSSARSTSSGRDWERGVETLRFGTPLTPR